MRITKYFETSDKSFIFRTQTWITKCLETCILNLQDKLSQVLFFKPKMWITKYLETHVSNLKDKLFEVFSFRSKMRITNSHFNFLGRLFHLSDPKNGPQTHVLSLKDKLFQVLSFKSKSRIMIVRKLVFSRVSCFECLIIIFNGGQGRWIAKIKWVGDN